MKILFLLLITLNIYSQGLIRRYYNQYDLIRNIKKDGYEPNINLTFNIRFIYLGEKPTKLTSDKILLIKNRLDNAFGMTKIRFTYDSRIYSYRTTMTIDSCNKYGCRLIDRATYNRKDINFYIVENDGNIYNGLSTYPSSDINRLFIHIDHLNDGTMEHEMGHYFGLLHTFDRTVGVSEYNSEEEGDMVSDTKTDKEGLEYTSGCKLVEKVKDSRGVMFDVDLSNYMSYYGICRNRFTSGQIKLMNKIAKYRKQFI
jgi:hypothetical protein